MLGWAETRWRAPPHVAAALAWKEYTYWLAVPVVLGWTVARRVPLLTPADVLVRHGGPGSLLTLSLRRSVRLAVLADDPLLVTANSDRIRPAATEADLLAELSESFLGKHLDPFIRTLTGHTRIGVRPLRGSVSAGVAHAFVRAAVPGTQPSDLATILSALGLDDLVRLRPGPGGTCTVERRTCCLAFTLPERRACRGCCLAATWPTTSEPA
ncbi:hypothetical protein [Pseudonocardia sp. ICBG1142]|uniref:hypothetical protein n=1 Tax=Pseudonocardia sp. ICBG1142 TaxID=2846760 RepID=UPI001CF6C82B|nr:hypothetical protein [Pseudonocardia sp. ICBG1142]